MIAPWVERMNESVRTQKDIVEIMKTATKEYTDLGISEEVLSFPIVYVR